MAALRPVPLMPRKKTIAAFEEWVKDEANVEDLLRRVAETGKLQKVCLELKRPYTLVHPYLHSTPELKGRYEAARAAWADALHDEALDIADKVKPEQGHVSKAKLQCEVRVQSAKAYNRDRFGETLRVERPVEAPSDAGLLGFASELLKLVKAPAERPVGRLIEPEQVPSGEATSVPVPARAAPVVFEKGYFQLSTESGKACEWVEEK